MEGEPAQQQPKIDLWFDRWPTGLLVVAVLLSIGTLILSSIWYGGQATWPSVITNFAATSLAFLVVLAWDRRQRAIADLKAVEAEERREAAEGRTEQERRETEAKRRFSAIALELERLQSSLQRSVDEQQRYKYFFPDLPSGSWQAGGGPLGTIISNYGLMADLSTFYGHVDELRWRLRFKAQPGVDGPAVNPIIDALASQMLSDVTTLVGQVRKQIAQPDVRPVQSDGAGLVVARRQLTGAIRSVDIEHEPAASAVERP
jgi:hypothetical protein